MREDLQNEFIDGWHWAISNPSHGDQGFIMNDKRKKAVEYFKVCAQIRREYMIHAVEQGPQMEVEQGLQETGLQERIQNELVVATLLSMKVSG